VSYARKPQSEHWGTPLEIRSAGSAAEPARAADNHVGPDYLQALGVSLVAGREFSIDEGSAAARTVFINRAVADELWPGQPPVGRRVLIGRGKQTVEAEVVGVAEDAFFTGNRFAQQSRYIFLSAQQDPALPGQTTFYVRYSGSLDTIAPAVGRAIRDVDPRVPIANLRTMDSQLAVSSPPFRLLAMLLMLFAGGSLLIATIGQYAVVAFDMRRRARELGLRIALGASSTQMLSSILRDGFRFTAVGLTIGFALSLAVGRALGGFLYGITPTDPVTYLGVFALLCAASLLASYLPARRAARIDPITILRSE
jgi:putative ABC transport system permease protein